MHLPAILRVTGILLSTFSLTVLAPVAVALIYRETETYVFGALFLLTGGAGCALWLTFRGSSDLRSGDGFVVTVLFYLTLALFGALPFMFDNALNASFTDAFFESMSGLTTTGGTVFTNLDALPKSLLFYRQLLQWFGGMGIIVLAVAILPMLGVGGMQLYRAESPGPVKDNKLTPRIAGTAKALWTIYVALTATCAAAYYAFGMGAFDAICHAFSTVAIGGFSTHDLSLGYFNSSALEIIAMVFMVLSAINFGLHFSVFTQRRPALYWKDPEAKSFLGLMVAGSAVVVWALSQNSTTTDIPMIDGAFHFVSIATTTGFATTDYSGWPTGVLIVLMSASFAGGCAGSTAGGLKIIRVMLIYLQGVREVRTLVHPNGVFVVKLGESPVADRVIAAVWSFCAVYALSFFLLFILVGLVSGLDFESAFSAVAACLNNVGPGLGSVISNYQALNDPTKWILAFTMLLGRLEIFTLLVILTPTFWRR